MNESTIDLLPRTHLGGCKSCIEFKQESIAQLSLGIELCSLARCFDLRIASLLILNLVTTIACYFPLYNACFTTQIVSLEISPWWCDR
jgi:hypothetical protein